MCDAEPVRRQTLQNAAHFGQYQVMLLGDRTVVVS